MPNPTVVASGFAFFAKHDVPWPITVLFALLLTGLIVCLAMEEQIHAKKSLIAGVFAIICLLAGTATGVLTFDKIIVGSTEVIPTESEIKIEPLDHSEDLNGPITINRNAADKEPADHTSQTDDPQAKTVPEDDPSATDGGEEDHHLFLDGEQISMPVYIPGIDWGVIAIIFGSSLFVDAASKSGIFSWIAIKVTKASGGDPLRLLFFYGIMTVVFSAVLNNVTAMIIVGSLTVVSLEKLGRREMLLGFLLIEGLLTNIGGLLTLISSVPNIIVGTTAEISFVEFFRKSAPYVLVATLVTLWMGAKAFNIGRLKTVEEKDEGRKLVSGFDENDGVESKSFFWFSTIVLVLFILTIAFASVIPFVSDLGMGFVALSYAAIMLIRFKSEVNRFYSSIDWDLLGFFMALFAIIYVMEHAGVLASIGTGLQMILQDVTSATGNKLDAAILLVGSAAFSSVTDNIPLAAMLAKILQQLGAEGTSSLWWSVIFGANLGGNITPIGSASTLVAVTIMHKHGLKLSFAGFVKAAFLFAIIQITIAILYVLFILPML